MRLAILLFVSGCSVIVGNKLDEKPDDVPMDAGGGDMCESDGDCASSACQGNARTAQRARNSQDGTRLCCTAVAPCIVRAFPPAHRA